jgi:hypothetical protein
MTTLTTTLWADGPITLPCFACGGEMVGTGSIATGKTLPNGYTPDDGEILSISRVKCPDCGDWQVS